MTPAPTSPPRKDLVLVVDDSPIDRRLAAGLLGNAGYATKTAENGRAALLAMEEGRPDLVLTDLAMPEMDGLALVEAVRARWPEVPVILMTGVGSEEIAVRALQRGAASYVPKRELAASLASTVRSILAVRSAPAPASTREDAPSSWEVPSDLAEIGPLVARLEARLGRSGLTDETGRLQVSVALREALANAILHGNLQLSSSLKEDDPEAHDRLLAQRRETAPYRDRRVRLTVEEGATAVTYVVRDEGDGFDPAALPDPTDAANLERTTGRGLFLIRTFMDEVRHADGGRTLTMVKRRSS